ncbi:hypothetical protein LTR97_004179 [Elasticomyces elasticus]|uniref:BTB domain-containing protein n=1 Tax=Elasticomyces elasticus TaxID=574655 RepID=A0AAN7WFC5_9PEZI|nr:hypothetical protein LTR97_004179 [Elasticomyces elasticus]
MSSATPTMNHDNAAERTTPLHDPQWTDLTGTCEEHEFPVHRNIICSKSSHVLGFVNGNKGRANLVFEDTYLGVKIFRRMLDYIYSNDYDMGVKLSVPSSYSAHSTDAAPESHATFQSKDPKEGRGIFSILKDLFL